MRFTYNWEKEYIEINAKRHACSSAEEFVNKYHHEHWKYPYQPMHNITRKDMWNKLGQLEDILEKHNIKSVDDLDESLTALKIIKEKPVVALVDYKYTYEEWLELVDEREKDLFKNKEEYDLLKEALLCKRKLKI